MVEFYPSVNNLTLELLVMLVTKYHVGIHGLFMKDISML